MSMLKIKNTAPVQKDFWGNGAIYHGYAGMPDECGRVYTEEQCIEEARRIKEMRLKIARTFYGWWAWDEKTNTWDWENDTMKAFYRWLGRMKDAGVTVALNMGWCSPGDINSSSWNGKSPFTVEGDWEKSLENYGNFASETVYQLIEKRGFDNVKIFVLFTEPQRYSGKPNDPTQTPFELWADGARAAHKALVRDGRRDKIILMGPNEGSTAYSPMVKHFAETEPDIVDIFSSHNYQWVPAAKPEFIKTGNTYCCLTVFYSRMSRRVSLKPNTEYEAVIDMLYKSDFPEQEGSYIFGVCKDHPSGDIQSTGLAAKIPGSTVQITPSDLSEDYKKISVKFNSGDGGDGVFGIFCALKSPKELDGKTACVTNPEDRRRPGYCFIDSMVLLEGEEKKNIIENAYFENEYDGWFHNSTAGGVTEPYKDWCMWANTALDFIPGERPDKAFCYDEYNITYDRDNGHHEMGAELFDAAVAFMNCGVRFSLLWTLFDQQWPNNHSNNADSFVDGDHRCGLMPVLTRSYVPHKAYYAFTLVSRYVDAHSAIYEGEGENAVHTTMAVSPEGDVTVIVVNHKAKSDDFTLCFDKAIGQTFYRHNYDPDTLVRDESATIIPADKEFAADDTLCDTIAPYGVIVYTTKKD